MTIISPANLPDDLPEVRRLFQEYADGRGVDLGFQSFEEEIAGLPGKYAAPFGRLLVAWKDGVAVGCVALRRLDAQTAEMKRLYLHPSARGEQLGRRLVERICDEARSAGYSRICLDTLPTMTAAQKLYQSLGFEAVKPYAFNPVEGTKFLARSL
jgi:ribosomal protein S18 acetylase RimI-like enzyme